MTKIKPLRRCEIFKPLSFRDLAILAHVVKEKTAKKGTFLAKEGESSSGFALLVHGKVSLSSDSAPGVQINLGPGDFFGEMSFIRAQATRVVEIKAIDETTYLSLGSDDFARLKELSPEVAGKVAQGVLEVMATRIQQSREALSETGS